MPLDPLATTPEGASSVLEGVTPPAVEEVEGGVDNPAFPREEEGVDLDHPDAAPTPTVVAAAPVAVPAQEERKAAR